MEGISIGANPKDHLRKTAISMCHRGVNGREWIVRADEFAFESQLSYSLVIRPWKDISFLRLNVPYVQILLVSQTKWTS